MKSFNDFINEKMSKDDHDIIKSFFEKALVEDLIEIFTKERINKVHSILDDNFFNIEYSIKCSDIEEENEHNITDEDDLYFNAGYTLKVLKNSIDVIEKSSSLFNKNPNNKEDMESFWNEGNFGMGISLAVYFTLEELYKRYKEKIPNEIKSLLGISKYNL